RPSSSPCGTVSYPQSSGERKSFENAAGTRTCSFRSRGPASRSSTLVSGSSESRDASTQPADPAPTITTSCTPPSIRPLSSSERRSGAAFEHPLEPLEVASGPALGRLAEQRAAEAEELAGVRVRLDARGRALAGGLQQMADRHVHRPGHRPQAELPARLGDGRLERRLGALAEERPHLGERASPGQRTAGRVAPLLDVLLPLAQVRRICEVRVDLGRRPGDLDRELVPDRAAPAQCSAGAMLCANRQTVCGWHARLPWRSTG